MKWALFILLAVASWRTEMAVEMGFAGRRLKSPAHKSVLLPQARKCPPGQPCPTPPPPPQPMPQR